MSDFESLMSDVKKCTICEKYLPHGVRPVLQISPQAKILIVGQAPGRKVHESGVPFDDASGNRLREWMGINSQVFYDDSQVAILPMGFCYPGTGKSGDLPPRPECELAWRKPLLDQLNNLKLTLVLGVYAQDYHFNKPKRTVTELVKSWKDFWPEIVPLPHPSPRNNIWLRKNEWFENEILPSLQKKISEILNN